MTDFRTAVASEDGTCWKAAWGRFLGERERGNVLYLDSTVGTQCLFVKTHPTVCFRPVHFILCKLHLTKKKKVENRKIGQEGLMFQ